MFNGQRMIVTCSHHLNLTDFEVGASCSIALQGKAKASSFFLFPHTLHILLDAK